MTARAEEPTRVLAVASFLDRTPAIENVARHIDRERFVYHGAFLHDHVTDLQAHLRQCGWSSEHIPYRGKRDLLTAGWRLARAIRSFRPHVVHTFMVDATYLGLAVAWALRVPRRIHTRYHSDLHHEFFPHAIKYDRLANRLSTAIVAPGLVAQEILTTREGVPPQRVHLINDPFDLDLFAAPPRADVAELQARYNPAGRRPVIGVVSRFVDWKGVQFVIPAVGRLRRSHPDLLLVLANAHGPLRAEIDRLLREHLPSANWIQIPFEPKNHALFHLFDAFVHVPIGPRHENTGGVYCEAFAAGRACVITLSGVAPEFAVDGENCLVVPYRDQEAIHRSLERVLEDRDLAARLRAAAPGAVLGRFGIREHLARLERLYAGVECPPAEPRERGDGLRGPSTGRLLNSVVPVP